MEARRVADNGWKRLVSSDGRFSKFNALKGAKPQERIAHCSSVVGDGDGECELACRQDSPPNLVSTGGGEAIALQA